MYRSRFFVIIILSPLFFGITFGPKWGAFPEAHANPIVLRAGVKYVQALLKESAGRGLKKTGKKIFGPDWQTYEFLFTPIIKIFPDITKSGAQGEKAVELAVQALEENSELRQDIEARFANLEKRQQVIFEQVTKNTADIAFLMEQVLQEIGGGKDGIRMTLVPGISHRYTKREFWRPGGGGLREVDVEVIIEPFYIYNTNVRGRNFKKFLQSEFPQIQISPQSLQLLNRNEFVVLIPDASGLYRIVMNIVGLGTVVGTEIKTLNISRFVVYSGDACTGKRFCYDPPSERVGDLGRGFIESRYCLWAGKRSPTHLERTRLVRTGIDLVAKDNRGESLIFNRKSDYYFIRCAQDAIRP